MDTNRKEMLRGIYRQSYRMDTYRKETVRGIDRKKN